MHTSYKSGSGDAGSLTYLKTGIIVCAANLCRQALSELPDPPLLYQLHYKLLERRQDVFGSDSMGQIWGEAIHEWFESVPQCLPAMGMSYVSELTNVTGVNMVPRKRGRSPSSPSIFNIVGTPTGTRSHTGVRW
jgi:hypothetical protein